MVIIGLAHPIHALTLDRVIQYLEVGFSSPKIPADLDNYQIAFISDTHYLPEETLRGIVDELNHRELDLIVFGGDVAIAADTSNTVEILSHLKSVDGIYGVEGNHDNYALLFAAMEKFGMKPLSNSGEQIRPGFFLAGVEDLWRRNPDISLAIAGSKPEDFVLLLAHNPDLTMQQDTSKVDLVLSGHTHGGEITFLGLWAPILAHSDYISEYGQRFQSGWSQARDGTPVFVSNGLGVHTIRVFARPQVILLTLIHQG